jgi:hypothetical protein
MIRMRVVSALAVMLCVSGIANAQVVPAISIPRPEIFTGVTNPKITPENMNRNICRKGWSTSSIRPRSSYTTALKLTELHTLEYTKSNPLPRVKTASGTNTRPDTRKCVTRSANPSCYEEDHLISLELGGHPTDPANLWPEPWFGAWNARDKDKLENRLHAMVCSGDILLRDAQRAIAADWVAAFKMYVGEN